LPAYERQENRAMAQPMYFEDWVIGRVYETGSREITHEIVDSFNEVEAHKGPMHNDPEAAKESIWGRMSMHGMLIMIMASGLMADMDMFDESALAFLGVKWSFSKGAFIGDTIRVRWHVGEKRLTSKPGRGIIVRHVEVINQDDEVICSGQLTSLWKCRAADAAA
jgi:acyl dehydratase